jgi:hypothetical protein
MTRKPPDRDLRIDLLRGACLLLIYTRHVHPNFFRKYTPSEIGFSDAAEAFIFLSGFVCGRAYAKALESGLLVCQLKALRRCWQIYVAHIFTLLLNLAIMPAIFGSVDPTAAKFFNEPRWGLEHVFLLAHFPYSYSILALYIFLIAPLPLMLWLGRKITQWGMIALSFAIYAVVQCFPGVLELPKDWVIPFGFNPFAWQFLFCCAAAVGNLRSEDCRVLPNGRLAMGCVVAGLAVLFVCKFNSPSIINPFRLPPDSLPWGKADLEPLRLLHFALVAYLCWMVMPESSRWYRSRIGLALIQSGQNSLAVFCFSVFVTNVAKQALRTFGSSIWRELAANLGGWLFILLFGAVLHKISSILLTVASRREVDSPKSKLQTSAPATAVCAPLGSIT